MQVMLLELILLENVYEMTHENVTLFPSFHDVQFMQLLLNTSLHRHSRHRQHLLIKVLCLPQNSTIYHDLVCRHGHLVCYPMCTVSNVLNELYLIHQIQAVVSVQLNKII